METYRYQVYDVQQQKTTNIKNNKKSTTFCEINWSQPKKHELKKQLTYTDKFFSTRYIFPTMLYFN